MHRSKVISLHCHIPVGLLCALRQANIYHGSPGMQSYDFRVWAFVNAFSVIMLDFSHRFGGENGMSLDSKRDYGTTGI